MEQLTKEITREYRLNFNKGEPEWDDPIPPDVTSNVLGYRTTCIINRTSLLAWSLMMLLPQVEVADLARGGWIEIRLRTESDFDELSFQFEVAELVESIREFRAHRAKGVPGFVSPPRLRSLASGLINNTGLPPSA